MQNHGPFTIGKDARSAVKAAVMCEEVARTVHIARQLGEPLPIDPAQIDSLYDRYQNVYGRRPTRPSGPDRRATRTSAGEPMSNANNTSLEQYEVWFLTGSQHLYGEDVLKQVAAQSQEIADALNASADVPVKVVWKPVLTDSDAIRRTALEANSDDAVIGVTAWMHTFSPGQDVDPGPGPAPQAAPAPAHPGQRRTALGGHRLRLHEPEPGRARRPRVRLHPVPPRHPAQDRRRPRLQPRGVPPGRHPGSAPPRAGPPSAPSS